MSRKTESHPNVFISIIIPAFNEEHRIGKTLEGYLKRFGGDSEVIVVLNGCQDNTLKVVEGFQDIYPKNLKWLNIPERIGKGWAIIEGLKIARGKLVGYVDADGSTSPEDFQMLIDQIQNHDGVIASRFIPGAEAERSFIRIFFGKCFFFITKLLFWLPFRDTQCGAKIFRSQVILHVLPHLTSKDMVFDVDLLYHVVKKGFKIIEVPTIWVEQRHSAVFSSHFKLLRMSLIMLFSLIKLRIRTFLDNSGSG